MPIVGVAWEGACTNHQSTVVRGRNAGLDPELVGLTGFALANALDFRRV